MIGNKWLSFRKTIEYRLPIVCVESVVAKIRDYSISDPIKCCLVVPFSDIYALGKYCDVILLLLFEKEQRFTLTIQVKDDRVLLYRLEVTDLWYEFRWNKKFFKRGYSHRSNWWRFPRCLTPDSYRLG